MTIHCDREHTYVHAIERMFTLEGVIMRISMTNTTMNDHGLAHAQHTTDVDAPPRTWALLCWIRIASGAEINAEKKGKKKKKKTSTRMMHDQEENK